MSTTPSNPSEEGQGYDPQAAHPSNFQAATRVFGRCDRHWFDPALATCNDCHSAMCVDCVVAVEDDATYCAECALVRAGVKARRTRSNPRSRRQWREST